MQRREWMLRAAALTAWPAAGWQVTAQPAATPEAQVVRIVARRFQYEPPEFEVKAGRPVVLEFTALDFVHGFSMPDLKLRADLLPGRVTRVNLTVAKPGEYEFLCDNFCGEGHETMGARMRVVAG